jgi:hypothetical protein
MIRRTLTLTALLAVTIGAANAQDYANPAWYYAQGEKYAYQAPDPYAELTPVMPHQLDDHIGETLKGKAWAPLGIVAAASREQGTIALVGRHGEVATIHHSMLGRNGMELKAPTLTYGDIARASHTGKSKVPLRRGEIIIGMNSQ